MEMRAVNRDSQEFFIGENVLSCETVGRVQVLRVQHSPLKTFALGDRRAAVVVDVKCSPRMLCSNESFGWLPSNELDNSQP